MSNTTIIGIDTAKSVFYLHAMDSNGKQVFRKKLRRSQLLPFIAQHPPVTLAMEACGGNNYWARQFTQHHHQVKLIHAKHVKAYLHKNKNDYNDAEAIAEAASRSKTKRVPHKNISQQEIQSIHCLRESVMKNKVASANRIRGLLLEFGIPIPKSHTKLKINIPLILEDAENELTDLTAFQRTLNFLFQQAHSTSNGVL